MSDEARHLDTRAVHAGHDADPTTGAVTPPIHLSTTFERDPDGGYPRGFMYARYANPNREMLEACLADLEEATGAVAFGSGQAASSALFQSLKPGDHLIAAEDAYFGTGKLLREVFGPWGLATTFVDMTDLDAVRSAFRPTTRLVWVESPSNPLLKITDITAVSELAHRHGALVACDNTWATPVLNRPLQQGADLVVHATTKYLGGHSDVMGGVVLARDAGLIERLRAAQGAMGAIPSPFDCWLVLRGVKTLALRVRRQSDSALQVARFLAAHPAVEAVHYPGLPAHPGHAVAARQMSGFGGMLSAQIRGGRDTAMDVVARCRLFTRATSLGGVESLIEHRKSNEAPESSTPENLLRISIGIEHPDDLIADLAQALR